MSVGGALATFFAPTMIFLNFIRFVLSRCNHEQIIKLFFTLRFILASTIAAAAEILEEEAALLGLLELSLQEQTLTFGCHVDVSVVFGKCG